MTDLSRRNFGKQAFKLGGALSLLTLMNLPEAAQALKLDKLKDNAFLKRDDIDDALRSLYMTYDSTTPYPHKFNEVISKAQIRSIEFCIDKGIQKDYVAHYIMTMEPLLRRINGMVAENGPEKGLVGMFESTTCSYQLYERINIKEGERSFPCPYKGMLATVKKWLGTFTIEWNQICNDWCTPVWTGFADKIGIKISIHPAETCAVKLVNPA